MYLIKWKDLYIFTKNYFLILTQTAKQYFWNPKKKKM